jgi:hypothetical protein
MPAVRPALKALPRACRTASSSTSMRCGCAMAAGAGARDGLKGWATAARGFDGSSAAGRMGPGGLDIPGGGGTEEGGMGVSDPPRCIAGAIEGAGMLPVAGGGGVAPAGPPIFCSRDLRSIFGFLSSAIVRSRPYVCGRQRVNATSTLERHFLDSRYPQTTKELELCSQLQRLTPLLGPRML